MSTIKITQLPAITGANTAQADVIPLVDVSLDITNKITREEFFKNIQTDVEIADKIVHTGDTNTAIRFPNADTVSIETNGVERLRVNSQGRIGIGTNAPRSGLHISGAGQTTADITDAGPQDSFLRVSSTDSAAGSGGGILFSSAFTDDDGAVGMAAIKGLVQGGAANSVGDLAFSTRDTTADTNLTERMRINYKGAVSIGSSSGFDRSLTLSKNITGGTISYGILNNGAVQNDVTGGAYLNRTLPTVVNSAFTLPALYHYAAAQSTIGASATVTSQVGFLVEGNLIGATTNVGFSMNGIAAASVTAGKFVYSFNSNQNIASGGGTAFNLYLQGTAPNYIAGNVGIGTTTAITPLHVVGATVTTGVVYKNQPAQTSKAAAATLTIAELLTGIVQYTGAAATLTLPTGTLIEGGVPATLPVDMSFDVSVINTGAGIATLGTATGLTLVGSMAVAIGASGLFRLRKTAANTYTVYRVS